MEKSKTGTACVRDKKGKKIKTIIINGEGLKNATKAGLIGTGRQRKTGTDEKGLEMSTFLKNTRMTSNYQYSFGWEGLFQC